LIHCVPLHPLSTYFSTTLNTNIRDPGGIRTRNPSKRWATRPQGSAPWNIQPTASRYIN
jgi:hypothetical protein